jgi:hypothetical protein
MHTVKLKTTERGEWYYFVQQIKEYTFCGTFKLSKCIMHEVIVAAVYQDTHRKAQALY